MIGNYTCSLLLIAGSIFNSSCKKENGFHQDPGMPDTTGISHLAPSSAKDTFWITNDGAGGDGVTLNTAAVQTAIDSAAAHDGVVVVPTGNFLCGPVTLYSHITLLMEDGATLLLRNDITNYPESDGSYLNFISASNATDITITGSGTVDGQGAVWWPAYKNNTLQYSRPQLFDFNNCSNIRVMNIHTQNPPNTHFTFRNCDSVLFDNVTITAPSTSPNTDGINICGNHIVIRHCNIRTGDDNIAFSEGGGASSDITVTDCMLGYGHGLSIGSYTKYGLNGLTVDSCIFNGTTSGIRMKSSRDRGGVVQNLSYSNITMTNVQNPIFISSYYPKTPAAPQDDSTQAVTAATPVWKNMMMNNISISDCPNSIVIWGLPEMGVDSVQFNNVNISATNGMQIYFAKKISFQGCTIHIQQGAEVNTYDAGVTGL